LKKSTKAALNSQKVGTGGPLKWKTTKKQFE